MTLPNNPRELGLPHDAWRKGQKEAAELIAASEKKYVVLQAPTGTGKSLIGLAAGIEMDARSVFLCRTKQLQDQYAAGYEKMHIVKGRNNFVCSRFPQFSADRAPCRYLDQNMLIQCHSDCAYKKQMYQATAEKQVVANYPLYLALWKYSNSKSGWRDFGLVVCDEAHLLEQELAGFIAIRLSKQSIRQQRLLDPKTENLFRWRQWGQYTSDMLFPEIERIDQELADTLAAGQEPSHEQLLDLACLKNLFEQAGRISRLSEEWVIADNGSHYLFTPAWVGKEAPKFFARNSKVLFMSATVLDPQIFCELLGIGEDEYEFIDMPAIFPKEHRRIVYSPVARLSHNCLDAELPKMVQVLDKLLDYHHGDKGIIHSHNYKIGQYIYEHSRHRARMITHTGQTREAALALFKRESAPCTLISPSMATGVSLDDDYARYGIIAKVPFPDQGDKLVAKRLETGGRERWYNYATAANLVQATGRIVRSEHDWGTNYILDSNFGWFYKQNQRLFPRWWRDALEVR